MREPVGGGLGTLRPALTLGSGKLWIGNLRPFAGGEIDHRLTAGAAAQLFVKPRAEPAPQRADQEEHTDKVGDEARQEQQQAGEDRQETATVGLDTGDVAVGDSDAKMGKSPASGAAQHQGAADCCRQHQGKRPAQADQDRDQHEHRDFHQREQ